MHGNRHTDFVAVLCAAHLHQAHSVDPEVALAEAARAGLRITPEACALLGVDQAAVNARLEVTAMR